jgi:hypothetical protein
LRPQLRNAVAQIKESGHRDIAVAGMLRLSTAMAIGVELPDVAGFTVAVRQRDGEWSSSGERAEVALHRADVEIGQGDQLAIAVSVAVDVGADVLAYLDQAKTPVATLVNLLPARGVGRDAIRGPEEARGLAQELLDAIRGEVRGHEPPLHLFTAGPLGLSLLLGHVWNRMPETQLYDDLGAGRGYAATFRLAG